MIELVLMVMEPFVVAAETVEAGKHPPIGFVLGMVCLLRKQTDEVINHNNTDIGTATLDMGIYFNQVLRSICTNSSRYTAYRFSDALGI